MNTIILGLNEIKFDYVKAYIKRGELNFFSQLLENHALVKTQSESEYHLLEPWIQWVTVNTGLSYSEHEIFRLGDIVHRQDIKQIFEELEDHDKSVGAVSPFNAENRLKNASFFIPDPWTETSVSGSAFLGSLYFVIKKAVNSNAQKNLNLMDGLVLFTAILKYSKIKSFKHYLKLLLSSNKPGNKAAILDSLLADVFIHLFDKHQPDFSSLFLNAGAHIQHHYMFNSAVYSGDIKNPDTYCSQNIDPLLNILKIYDAIVGRLLDLPDVHLVVATGLSQDPYLKHEYYWRLRNYQEFLAEIGILNSVSIEPRMSRDFLLIADSDLQALECEEKLLSVVVEGSNKRIFSVDNRGVSLFVELIYDEDILTDTNFVITTNGTKIGNLKEKLVFVAFKNGMHNSTGTVISTENLFEDTEIRLEEIKPKIVDYVLSK